MVEKILLASTPRAAVSPVDAMTQCSRLFCFSTIMEMSPAVWRELDDAFDDGGELAASVWRELS
jgi:hypothetical protein